MVAIRPCLARLEEVPVMRFHAHSVLLVVGLFALSGVAIAQRAGPAPARLDAHRSLGAPKTFRNLTLIPVYDSAAHSTQHYLTLDEGLKAKIVTVEEAPSGGEVNTLFVTNRGKDPLYLMA